MGGARLPERTELHGTVVRLDMLTEDDTAELGELLRDPELYRHGFVMHRRPESADDARDLATERYLLRQDTLDGIGGGRLAFAVRLVADGPLGAGGTLVGTSALLEAHVVNESIHAGSTCYGRRWWGTAVNAETKLLLLEHCFDACGFGRVKLQTDALNVRSRAAIARLGAREEGLLRRDMRREDGTFRDTVVFSILRDEWPQVQQSLRQRLEASAGRPD